MEPPWLSTILTLLEDIPYCCPIEKKKHHHGCFGRLSGQGSAVAAFNPLPFTEMCVAQIRVLFLSYVR